MFRTTAEAKGEGLDLYMVFINVDTRKTAVHYASCFVPLFCFII